MPKTKACCLTGQTRTIKSRSLNQKAKKLLDMETRRTPFEAGHFMWREVQDLFDAVDRGHHVWGIPPYNGGLFDSDRRYVTRGRSHQESHRSADQAIRTHLAGPADRL